MDGGADSCIGGIGLHILAYTGHKANLVGYDDRHTKKDGLDICTLVTRYQQNSNSKPMLLVAHEMIYNPGSCISLLSEFQLREHSCVIDSVSRRHRKNVKGDLGTQSFYPRDDLEIPLKVMKGLLGFYIQEPTQEELDTLDRVKITSDQSWHPREFQDNDMAVDFHQYRTSRVIKPEYGPNDTIPAARLTYYDLSDEHISPIGVRVDILKFPATNIVLRAQAILTYHHTRYPTLQPEQVQPFLAYRPLEVVRKDPGTYNATS